ncbi:hypothetical protein AGMMS50229_06400 [Campylobacterota bacterium]|nr:hypothetical protein AGMMS50229_06400 [Campylobacterota bacterium]
MVKKIDFKTLYTSDRVWLKSRYHFSFAEYFDPNNVSYGVLKVLNDDIVQPNSGFGEHPHKNMEIFSYVVDGELTHGDSLGNQETLRRGGVQYMSAASGIWHSEMNEHTAKPVRFIQVWIKPKRFNLNPEYDLLHIDKKEREDRWLHILGDEGSSARINIRQDANIYVSELGAGKELKMPLAKERQLYLKVMEGNAQLNDTPLRHGDAAIVEDEDLRILANSNAHLMAIEMAQAPQTF